MQFKNKSNQELISKIAKAWKVDEDKALEMLKGLYNAVDVDYLEAFQQNLNDQQDNNGIFVGFSLDEYLIFMMNFFIKEHISIVKLASSPKEWFDRASQNIEEFSQNIDDFIARAFDEAIGEPLTKKEQPKKDDNNKPSKSKKIIN